MTWEKEYGDHFRGIGKAIREEARADETVQQRLSRIEALLGLTDLGNDAADDGVSPDFDNGESAGLINVHRSLDPIMDKIHELGALLVGLVPEDRLDQGEQNVGLRKSLGVLRCSLLIGHDCPQCADRSITIILSCPVLHQRGSGA